MHNEDNLEALNELKLGERRERALDRRIVEALERAPEVAASIPADFATRVAARAPARRPVTVRETRYGWRAMWLGLLAVVAALLVVAVRVTSWSPAMLAVEGLLVVQFTGIVAWLSLRRWREG